MPQRYMPVRTEMPRRDSRQPASLAAARALRAATPPPAAEQRNKLTAFDLIELHSVRSLGRAGLEDNELARISQEQSGGNETIYLAMGEGGDVELSLKLGLKGSSEQDRSCSVSGPAHAISTSL